MSDESLPDPERQMAAPDEARIYLLPNLMTAGNLFCGFVAIIRCIQAKFQTSLADMEGLPEAAIHRYEQAVWFILAAVIFDLLDGRVARLGGRESLFGKEFDSIADTVSFGVAPALMVFFLILAPNEAYPGLSRVGWFIGFIYLLCATFRLARFNVITHPYVKTNRVLPADAFLGLPVPAAAGLVSSLLLFLLEIEDPGRWALVFPPLLLAVGVLMVSNIPYPAFKHVDWRTELGFRHFIILLAVIGLLWTFHRLGIFLVFVGYLASGPYILWRTRRKGRKNASEPPETTPEQDGKSV